MMAIGYRHAFPIANPNSLLDFELPIPTAFEQDFLVEVKAVSGNPVHTKVRASAQPAADTYRVLGFDATKAEFHLVYERVVGPKPETLDSSHAAALSLTAITAWELCSIIWVYSWASSQNPTVF